MAFLWVNTLQSQCPYDAGAINYGDVTPAGVGQTHEELNFVWGGDHFTLNATAGCVYTISMCGTTWDTQITVFDASQTSVAYNDDSCGLQSEITFTAPATAAYTIQVNEWNCSTNSTGAEYFGVTLVSCPGASGCNDPAACNYDANDSGTDGCCYDECLTLIAGGGAWDGEISWNVTDGGGAIVAAGADNDPTGTEVCLPEGCYTVNYFDSFGDGWNGANFVVLNGADQVFSGTLGAGATGSEQFCTEFIPPDPPCYNADPTGCPDVDAGPDIVLPECTDPCTPMDVTADVFESGGTESYEVCTIDYNPPYPFNAGTGFSVNTDDVWS
ncbi:MAG: PPC domain-containing protein, partial [Bacteroidota bacterium]